MNFLEPIQGLIIFYLSVEEDKPPKPEELDEEPKPRALHKTFSLFFRNIAPVLTKKEIVDVSCVDMYQTDFWGKRVMGCGIKALGLS